MQVFLTGATGYVGAAIARELARSGAAVFALVRSEAKARAVLPAGVVPLFGDLGSLSVHGEVLASADVIIHAAFDESQGEAGDVRATRALLAAARAPSTAASTRRAPGPRALIYTSSAYNLRTQPGSPPVDEAAATLPFVGASNRWQFELEREVLASADEALATSVLRLGFVYAGLGGTLPDLFEAATAHGASFYIGSGEARASTIHRADAARLYRAIAEQRARGIFHGVDSAPIAARDIAVLLAEALACPRGVLRVERASAPAELSEHTRGILERDVAVVGRRGASLGWQPEFEALAHGMRSAYEEWRAERAARRAR